MSKLPKNPPWQHTSSLSLQSPALLLLIEDRDGNRLGSSLGDISALMLILNRSEAEALQQLLNGECLLSWPNGRVQLGLSFPDLAVINNLVRQGLLDQAYEPTDADRAALQSWQSSIGLPSTTVVRSSDGGPRPRLAMD